MLELAPETEAVLREYAAREGVSVEELIARTFPIAPADTPTWRVPTIASSEAQRDALRALLNLPREELVRRNARSMAHRRAQLAEAAHATSEEIASADAEWEEHKKSMNAHRIAAGERPLFADAPSSAA